VSDSRQLRFSGALSLSHILVHWLRATSRLPRRSACVTADQLVVVGGLEFEERREFIATMTAVIARAEGNVELDCSQLDAIDEATLGMLVVLSRTASRRGARLVLERSSPRVRRDLETAAVSHMFDWAV
jgi:anti-anti-sigma factor